MAEKKVMTTLFLSLLILFNSYGAEARLLTIVAGAVVGAGVVAFGGPLVLGYVGFQAGGILAGSTAAGMMSTLGSGSAIVALGQSIGAAGVSAAAIGAGAATGGAIAGLKNCDN